MADDRAADDAFEAYLAGGGQPDGPARSGMADLSGFAQAVKAASSRAPEPSAGLASLFASGSPGPGRAEVFAPRKGTPGPPGRGRRGMVPVLLRATARLLGAGALAQAALGVSLALAGVTGAASADLLPGRVQDRVATVVEAVSPLEVPHAARHPAVVPQKTKRVGPAGTRAPSPRPELSRKPDAGVRRAPVPEGRPAGRPSWAPWPTWTSSPRATTPSRGTDRPGHGRRDATAPPRPGRTDLLPAGPTPLPSSQPHGRQRDGRSGPSRRWGAEPSRSAAASADPAPAAPPVPSPFPTRPYPLPSPGR